MSPLWKLWLQTAARHPDKAVVLDAGRAWTCRQLTDAARALSVRGRLVPIAERNGAPWLVRFLAAQCNGATALPLDASLAAGAQRAWVRRIGRVPRGTVCIKLTSGTTGRFKPVYCSAAHLIHDGRNICATMGIRPDDINLAQIPLGHSYGLGNLVMPLILQATPIVCAQSIAPREILELIRQHNVTVLPTVPAVLRALAALPATKPASLRLVISAGAALSADTARQFYARYGLKIHNFYGASETGGICYDRTGNATLRGRSVGRPLENVRVRIRPDGRVVVGGQLLADLGKWNRYGELQLIGRVGPVANIGGRKVAPAEVERALRAVPGVSDAWVAVLQDRRGNDYLAAAVETERAEVESDLRERLPDWQLPKRYFLARSLPRTERGKLDTAALREWLARTRPAGAAR
jgi:acyl-CoA synthetase (AMP-forming)/AMP-acid ligase II